MEEKIKNKVRQNKNKWKRKEKRRNERTPGLIRDIPAHKCVLMSQLQ